MKPLIRAALTFGVALGLTLGAGAVAAHAEPGDPSQWGVQGDPSQWGLAASDFAS